MTTSHMSSPSGRNNLSKKCGLVQIAVNGTRGDKAPRVTVPGDRLSNGWTSTQDQADNSDDEEDDKQDIGDVCRRPCNSREAQNACNDRDDQKCYSPAQHGYTSLEIHQTMVALTYCGRNSRSSLNVLGSCRHCDRLHQPIQSRNLASGESSEGGPRVFGLRALDGSST